MRIEVLWEQVIEKRLDHLVLVINDHITADGLAVGKLQDNAYRIRCHIVCDARWNVQQFSIRNLLDDSVASVTRHGNAWLDTGRHVIETLDACSDVDIMVTQFTNTLPIRRLGLAQGQAKELAVVYVKAPDWSLSRMEQRYTCISWNEREGILRHESLASGFTADLTVDEQGLVTNYPGIFKMVWKRIDG